MTEAPNRQLDRAKGALLAGALGDALGMPTQSCTPEEISDAFGSISDFVTPVQGHPIAHGLIAGSVTDDTEQTLLLAKHIISSPGCFNEEGWASSLIAWEKSVKERGLYDLLGPSTKRALEALLAGTHPAETGLQGDTNGAAMRIAPVGIATPVNSVPALISEVETTCRITHNTPIAISSASAVAAVVSAGIDGANVGQAIEHALTASNSVGKRFGSGVDFVERLELAFSVARESYQHTILDNIRRAIGTSVASNESVPAAFALLKFTNGDAWNAGVLAANLGGDTDTIGAIAAGMCGAISGASHLPSGKLVKLKNINQSEIDEIASGLLRVRQMRAEAGERMENAV
ncbi:MAG: ADP-ribosylglycohydrolase family protein [Pseudomonadota bacterium]